MMPMIPEQRFIAPALNPTVAEFHAALKEAGLIEMSQFVIPLPTAKARALMLRVMGAAQDQLGRTPQSHDTTKIHIELYGQTHEHAQDAAKALEVTQRCATTQNSIVILILERAGILHEALQGRELIEIAAEGECVLVTENELHTGHRNESLALDVAVRSWIIGMYIANLIAKNQEDRHITIIIGDNHIGDTTSAVCAFLQYMGYPQEFVESISAGIIVERSQDKTHMQANIDALDIARLNNAQSPPTDNAEQAEKILKLSQTALSNVVSLTEEHRSRSRLLRIISSCLSCGCGTKQIWANISKIRDDFERLQRNRPTAGIEVDHVIDVIMTDLGSLIRTELAAKQLPPSSLISQPTILAIESFNDLLKVLNFDRKAQDINRILNVHATDFSIELEVLQNELVKEFQKDPGLIRHHKNNDIEFCDYAIEIAGKLNPQNNSLIL